MRKTLLTVFLLLTTPAPASGESLALGNNLWPPFITGDGTGTAERIVCEALQRSGWGCEIVTGHWEDILQDAVEGQSDGIAALWFTPERAESLHFSAAYLTNRLVPVTLAEARRDIRSVANLSGLRVALEAASAYGDELMNARSTFNGIEVDGFEAGLIAVQNGEADVAIVDELVARDFMDRARGPELSMGEIALSYRELHFAISRRHPQAKQIVGGFNTAYQSMLRDGTVNRILDIDWLVTDLKADGVLDFVHRGSGVSGTGEWDDNAAVYPVGQAQLERIREPGFIGSNANYLTNEVEYQTPEAAMKALDPGKRCAYDSETARIVCKGR